jgi:tetratricopeptide (TPR) repeat protein
MPLVVERAIMEGQYTYRDFDLLIEPDPGGSYRARVLRSPAGESTPAQFTLPFSPVELENFVLKVGRGRRRTRGPGRPESAPLKDFGGKLFNAVFRDEVRDTLQRSLSVTRAEGVGMRLRLRLTDSPELAELPWEFLYDPRRNRFLAQSRRTPLVRYLDLPDPPQPLSVQGPLRLLVMISSPSGYPELDVEQEWDTLTGALATQLAEGQVIVERLAANMSILRARLRREEFHVLHFVGHGFYRADWQDGVLVMEDRNGQPHEVTGEELGGLLNEYDATRLVVLNACEGARTGASDPFAGMAQSLIQQGLPAVVAMQFEITDDAAIIFAHELYAAIADGYPLEAALAEARGAIRDGGNATEWGTPVLYSRAPDGHLFDLTGQVLVSGNNRRVQEEADRRAAEETARKAQEEADRRAEEQAARKAQEEADRQAKDLATRYAAASAAADAEDWDQALAGFTMVADAAPGYRDVRARIADTRQKRHIAKLRAEADTRQKRHIAKLRAEVRRLYQAKQWAAAVEVGQQLRALDPAAADPDGLVTSARAELANAEQAGRLDADYEIAVREIGAGNWRQAIEALERVGQVNPAYRATPALLDQARRQLTDSQRPRSRQSSGRQLGIFLNYRRAQSEYVAGRLHDRLAAAFGRDRIFTDVDSVRPGQDFTKVLEDVVGRCRVLLAIISRDWVIALDEEGRRRLENPHDWVRFEIETALSREGVLVIPVLTDNAPMPRAIELPGKLAELSMRQAVKISAEGFARDVDNLIALLQDVLKPT